MNFGALAKEIEAERNIVYFRRGLDELSLNITNACPNACVFCIRDRDAGWNVSNLYLDSDPSIEEIKEAFDKENAIIKGKDIKVRKVKICGYGEPVLRARELPEIIRHIRASPSDADIQLTTTGWPYFRFVSLEFQALHDLKNAGLTHVYLSMSATNRDDYLKLVKPGIAGPDERAFVDAIKFGVEAKKMGLDVTLGFINLPNMCSSKVKDFAENLGFKYKLRDMEE